MKASSETARESLLKSVPLFAALDGPALAALAAHAQPRRYAAGETLFREGDACTGVFVITSGAVRIFKLAPSGRELTLHVQEAPATVAEVPLVDGGPYPASVETVHPTVALFLQRQKFLSVCQEHPQVALAALDVFARRLRGLVALLEAVTFGGVRQRLARLLLEQARGGHERRLRCGATHQQLADDLGTVREVVSRNLSRFQAEGLIQLKPREIELLDPAGLEREAEAEL